MRIVKRSLRSLPVKVEYAIIFGSTACGERLRDSNIDLIVVSEDFDGMPFEKRIMLLQKSWKHKVPLEAFAFTPNEIELLGRRSIVVQEALERGIKITL
ncbi:MAG: nucleotidyltransferase domain-containing protein [Candidatus Nezhaarchaeales archaeon]